MGERYANCFISREECDRAVCRKGTLAFLYLDPNHGALRRHFH
ncbi:MAG: hypothetical protein RIB93_17190 [Coleofasciculus sp. D1-CHI-01]